MSKKCILIVLFSIFLFTNAFTQTQKEQNSPVGTWAKNFGTSEYFLEINDTEIKYINKKSEKYIRFSYQLEESKDPSEIIVKTYSKSDTLKLNEINEDLYYHLTKVSPAIPFKRDGDDMSIFLQNKKGKLQEMKLTLRSKKDETINTAKTLGTIVGAAVATYLIVETADHFIDKATMQSIADDCLEALDY